jgi:ABC-2 type transport system ATP-binding protein
MGDAIFEAVELTKEFGTTTALRHVSLTLRGPSIIGLIGRNGSGKTTLLRHIVGLQLPTSGEARTFGVPIRRLGHDQLAGLGVVPQVPSFVGWMSVSEQLEYVSRFYRRWDTARRAALLELLDLSPWAQVSGLSAGSLQKLAIVAALCHHPRFVLLDEPVSNLDPLIREAFLRYVLQLVQEDGATVVMSSHVLHDIESTVDWIVCLHEGAVAADAPLDDLKERYAEWRVTGRGNTLPERFDESFIAQQDDAGPDAARLIVRTDGADPGAFGQRHNADVEVAPINLQGLFPVLVGQGRHR